MAGPLARPRHTGTDVSRFRVGLARPNPAWRDSAARPVPCHCGTLRAALFGAASLAQSSGRAAAHWSVSADPSAARGAELAQRAEVATSTAADFASAFCSLPDMQPLFHAWRAAKASAAEERTASRASGMRTGVTEAAQVAAAHEPPMELFAEAEAVLRSARSQLFRLNSADVKDCW